MTIHGALRAALTEAAQTLRLPLFWEGEAFVPPMTPHLVGEVVIDRVEAASLGLGALTRTDGALRVDCVTVAGRGDEAATDLARRLAALFVRGTTLALDRGELVTATPYPEQQPRRNGRRLAVPLAIPYYALTQETV